MNSRFLRNGLLTLVLVVGTAALLYMFLFQKPPTTEIAYSGDPPAGQSESLQQLVSGARS